MLNRIQNILRHNSKLIFNILGSIGVKGLSLVVSLLALPAYIAYFPNQQVLGIWFSLLSILNWILVFDIGIGNGLRNHLVQALVDGNDEDAKRLISSAYVSIGVVSIIVMIVGYVLIGQGNWNKILNISDAIILNSTLITAIKIVYIGIVVQFFLKLILSILYAMQKPALSNFVSLMSQSLILVFVSMYRNSEPNQSLILLSIVYTFTINIPLIIATLYVFLKPLRNSRPNLKYYSRNYSKLILSLGYKFFWIQLTLLIINSSNEFIITQLFRPEEVVEYQIYNRIFSLFLMFFSILTVPIWSSVTQAYNEARLNWIKKMYSYLNYIALAISLVCLLLVPLFQYIVNFWLGEEALLISQKSALVFAVFNVIMIFIYSVSSISNGLGKLRAQFIGNSFAAILKIPLSIFLANIIGEWISIVLANVVVMFPVLIFQVLFIRNQLKELN